MPRAGAIVKRGSTVTVSVDGCQLGRGPISNIAHAAVPFLVGRTVTAAWVWAYNHDMLFRARLGPMRDATKPRLYDNYRIMRQSPAAGSKLSRFEGVCGDLACGNPTPLTVWGKQTLPQRA
jgi:hypothetical protein